MLGLPAVLHKHTACVLRLFFVVNLARMLRAALPLGVQLLPALRFGPALLQARHATTVASSRCVCEAICCRPLFSRSPDFCIALRFRSAGNGQKEGASHKVAAAFSLAAAATFAGSQWQAQADAAPVVSAYAAVVRLWPCITAHATLPTPASFAITPQPIFATYTPAGALTTTS